jgi:hypothetical protein
MSGKHGCHQNLPTKKPGHKPGFSQYSLDLFCETTAGRPAEHRSRYTAEKENMAVVGRLPPVRRPAFPVQPYLALVSSHSLDLLS